MFSVLRKHCISKYFTSSTYEQDGCSIQSITESTRSDIKLKIICSQSWNTLTFWALIVYKMYRNSWKSHDVSHTSCHARGIMLLLKSSTLREKRHITVLKRLVHVCLCVAVGHRVVCGNPAAVSRVAFRPVRGVVTFASPAKPSLVPSLHDADGNTGEDNVLCQNLFYLHYERLFLKSRDVWW